MTTKVTNQEPVAKVVLLNVEENKRLHRARLLCKHFQRRTHNWGLVAEEVDGIQAFALQQIQTQPLVPALRENIETDESTWKTTGRPLRSAAAELYPAHLQTVCFWRNDLCINAENKTVNTLSLCWHPNIFNATWAALWSIYSLLARQNTCHLHSANQDTRLAELVVGLTYNVPQQHTEATQWMHFI